MSISPEKYRVPERKAVRLADWPTKVPDVYTSKKDYHEILAKQVRALADRQRLHYASDRQALLVIFQAMDAAGKDGAIRHVMSGINPQGCQVFSFKHPSATELDHDFLWRTQQCLPERGRIGIFNRSYYEEVLIVRVHPEILAAQKLPGRAVNPETLWQQRFRSILDLERHLHANGTQVVKFFLHLSKDEQRKRFLDRIDDPKKNWKFSLDDVRERRFWDEYMAAYEACLSATSTTDSPWYVVPADDKKNARLIIAQTLLETLHSMELHEPEVSPQRIAELEISRRELLDEDKHDA